MTKPVVKPKIAIAELPEDSEAIFQAVGILPGEVEFQDKGATVKVGKKVYLLWYAKERRNVFQALKFAVKNKGATQRLIVHPRICHFPGRDEPYQVAFQVVGFISQKPIIGCISEELKDFEFRLAGMWQFIPVCQNPVVTVLRNFNDERLAFVKEADVLEKVRFMKSSHIPLLWSGSPIRPFRFNPKVDKEKQGSAAFIQVTAKFLPETDIFEFVALRGLPASNSPKCLKAGKADKAEALKLKALRKQQRKLPRLSVVKKLKVEPKSKAPEEISGDENCVTQL